MIKEIFKGAQELCMDLETVRSTYVYLPSDAYSITSMNTNNLPTENTGDDLIYKGTIIFCNII